jgi:protein TonB
LALQLVPTPLANRGSMSAMSATSVTMPSYQQRRNAVQAFGIALLIEAAIVVAAGVVLIGNAQDKPAISQPVPITITEVPPEEKPPEPKLEQQPPPPLPQPKLKQVVKQVMPKPQTPPPPQEVPQTPSTPAPVAAEPTAFTQPAPPPSAPSPPPPVNTGKADAQATYWGKVNAAVQASHGANYPQAAHMIRFNGKTRVEFHLQDGVLVGEPHVLVSCGNGMFDKSSVQAVQLAHYPAPPEVLRGENTEVTVWVQYDEH